MARRSRRVEAEDYIPEETEDYDEEDPPRRRKPRRDRDEEEEEEDERPPRRRRSRDEDDEEPPRRKRRRPRDEDPEDDPEEDEEEEDDEPPRRRKTRRARDDDEEEEERPRKRRRPRDEDDDEEDDDRPRRRKSRARDDEEDEDDRPKRRGKAKANPGWTGYQEVKGASSDYAKRLEINKIKGKTPEAVIKFLEDEPFASYGLHWFDEIPRGKKKGWPCLITLGEDKCPACDLGDKPSPKTLFNVAVLDNDNDWSVQVITAGTRMTSQIRGLAESRRGLTKDYWTVSAGPDGSGTGEFQRLRERDLDEDYGESAVLDDEELDDLMEELHVMEDVEQVPSFRDFRDAVRDLED